MDTAATLNFPGGEGGSSLNLPLEAGVTMVQWCTMEFSEGFGSRTLRPGHALGNPDFPIKFVTENLDPNTTWEVMSTSGLGLPLELHPHAPGYHFLSLKSYPVVASGQPPMRVVTVWDINTVTLPPPPFYLGSTGVQCLTQPALNSSSGNFPHEALTRKYELYSFPPFDVEKAMKTSALTMVKLEAAYPSPYAE